MADKGTILYQVELRKTKVKNFRSCFSNLSPDNKRRVLVRFDDKPSPYVIKQVREFEYSSERKLAEEEYNFFSKYKTVKWDSSLEIYEVFVREVLTMKNGNTRVSLIRYHCSEVLGNGEETQEKQPSKDNKTV